MKKIFVLTLLLSLAIGLSFGQNHREDKRAQMEALKIKFFTEELDLTEDEGEAFWPVYYQFEKDQKKIKKSIKTIRTELETGNKTEDELIQKIDEISDLEIRLSSQKKHMIKKCIPILGVEKSTKLVSLENKLRKKIAERVKNRFEEGSH